MDSWRDGVQTEIVLNHHACTDEDYSQFHPLDSKYDGDFEKFKDAF